MSEERTATTATAKEPASERIKGRSSRLGSLVRVRFGPDAPLTDDLFTAICAENSELRLERTARGELEIMAPAGARGSNKNFSIAGQFYMWATNEGQGLGAFFDSSAGFTLPNTAIRSPDVSWVAVRRWEALTIKEGDGFAPLCPDFVLELRSVSDRLTDLRKKMREYLAQGARLGWLIDPISGKVEIYRQGRKVETLVRPATLSGEDALPGFVLDLKGIINS